MLLLYGNVDGIFCFYLLDSTFLCWDIKKMRWNLTRFRFHHVSYENIIGMKQSITSKSILMILRLWWSLIKNDWQEVISKRRLKHMEQACHHNSWNNKRQDKKEKTPLKNEAQQNDDNFSSAAGAKAKYRDLIVF